MSERANIRTQTGAILLDAYREINSRRMFWIVMVLSVVVIGVFSAVGATNDGLSVLWWDVPGEWPNARLMYKMIFSQFVIGFYLTWIAAILALISTAGIFPDFLTGGAIDLYLSKPIGRGQLFLTMYVAGLLFVTLQVGVFSVAGFFVMGIRGHSWEPGLFLAVPIVVVFFSYLYGICALVGVMTRSTMAALLLTILAWFFIWTIDRADAFLTSQTQAAPMRQKLAKREAEQLERRIGWLEKRRAAATQKAAEPGKAGAATQGGKAAEPTADDAELFRLRQRRDRVAASAAGNPVPEWMETSQKVVVGIKTFVPKTRETIALLDRYLLPESELDAAMADDSEGGDREARLAARNMDATRGRSVWWVVGTSLVFEAVLVGVGVWWFKRRDFFERDFRGAGLIGCAGG